MAEIGVALHAELNANSGVNTLVAGRGYAITLPQNPTFPLYLTQIISVPNFYSLDNRNWKTTFIRVEGWGTTLADARAVSAAIDTVLNGYQGMLGGTVRVLACFQRGGQELFETETKEYRVLREYIFWHT